MDFFDAVTKRHSVRAYAKKPIGEGKLKQILEAANSAPSAHNSQAYEIFIAKDEAKKVALLESSSASSYAADVSVVLVFCANPKRLNSSNSIRVTNMSMQDATIAAAYTQLAATSLGLASVWIGSFDTNIIMKVLGNPAGLIPVAVIPIGYPAESPAPKPRRPLNDLVHKV